MVNKRFWGKLGLIVIAKLYLIKLNVLSLVIILIKNIATVTVTGKSKFYNMLESK